MSNPDYRLKGTVNFWKKITNMKIIEIIKSFFGVKVDKNEVAAVSFCNNILAGIKINPKVMKQISINPAEAAEKVVKVLGSDSQRLLRLPSECDPANAKKKS